jgi:TetR/AcrR family transcriptional regulator, fatty acid biosynthesis regulator
MLAAKQRMSIRDEKKRQTRQALMNAALELVGQGDNFASISLREVAKNAGVVPTSFYRHFQDMEELGLSLVDELGMMLRKLMRATRQGSEPEDQTRKSVEVYVNYVAANRNLFVFMGQCRAGGTPALRNAIRNELKYFANELVSDMRRAGILPHVDQADLEMIADLVIMAVADITIDILDLPEGNAVMRSALIARTTKQVRVIFLGATAWKSMS